MNEFQWRQDYREFDREFPWRESFRWYHAYINAICHRNLVKMVNETIFSIAPLEKVLKKRK